MKNNLKILTVKKGEIRTPSLRSRKMKRTEKIGKKKNKKIKMKIRKKKMKIKEKM